MLKLTPIFQERVERGIRFREYFYLCVLVVFSAYQLSGIGGTPERIEMWNRKPLYFLVAIGVSAAMGFIYGLYVLITISLCFSFLFIWS